MSIESGGEWDQFKANEQRFGLTSDYDENIYTTRIDKSHPLHRMREAEAERIAREIEGDTSTNAHVKEERGVRLEDDGIDEEERYVTYGSGVATAKAMNRYSGVRRNGHDFPPLQSNQSNKYTPPARRPLANSRGPIGNGSPLDPAIISSQIARSSTKPKEAQTTDATQSAKPAESSDGQKAPVSNLSRQNVAMKDGLSKPTLPVAPSKIGGSGVNATENVETELLDSFRQFANLEKMRVQDSRRNRASADKAIRLNDLMKFSKNFKLLTPVPKDLVPILAKDKSKQEEIMEKAQRNADQHGSVPGKLAISTDQKTQRPLAAAQWIVEPVASSPDVQHSGRGRQGVPSSSAQIPQASKDRHLPQVPLNQSSKSGRGLLSHRLEDTHRMHKAGIHVTVPAPLPIQDARIQPARPSAQASSSSSPQKASGVRSPSSAVSAKFNVRAMEFKPNPAASTFKPVTDPSDASSPRSGVNTRSVSRAPSPSIFFGDRKPLPPSERPSITAYFNPLKYLKAEAEKEKKTKEYASNGGIKPAFKTPPTWNPPKDGEDFKSYKDMFDAVRPTANGTTPQQTSLGNPPMAHQHQLPLHLQTGPQQGQVGHQVAHNPQSQPHHYPNNLHYDDHHMRPSVSQTSAYASPSPRMNYMNIAAYPSPMGQHAQLAYGQQMPQYFLGPHGPQPAGVRQYSGGPPMIAAPGPHLAAQMMVQQPSGGGIMGMQQPMVAFNPQFTMYNGVPPAFAGPPQPPSGYPSPGRGAPMMMNQGSHQGQHSQMYMAPNHGGQAMYAQHQPAHSRYYPPQRYMQVLTVEKVTPLRGYASPPPPYSQISQSPYQQHQYPHQSHRTPSNGYAQLSQTHHQHMGSQQTIPQAPPMDTGEGLK